MVIGRCVVCGRSVLLGPFCSTACLEEREREKRLRQEAAQRMPERQEAWLEAEKRMTEKRPMTDAEENLVNEVLSATRGSNDHLVAERCRSAAGRVLSERNPGPTKEEVEKLREAAMVARRAYRAAHIALYARDPFDDTLELTREERAVVEAAKAYMRAGSADSYDALVNAVRWLKGEW